MQISTSSSLTSLCYQYHIMETKPNSLTPFLCLLLLTCACSARQDPRHQSQSQFNECQLDSINALEPDNRVECEAGLTETWDAASHPELRCAGVTVLKRTIYSNGLHLPSYVTYPELHFIEQGNGVLGMVIPGCAETYEEPQWERKGRPQELQDRHQKIRYVKQGDIVAIPPGVPYWSYNYGDTPLVIISLLDTSSTQNQLDGIPRRFYLAGNPEEEHLSHGGRKGGQHEEEGENMFSGFDSDFLAQVLKVKEGTIRKLQFPREELKKQIIKVKGGLSIIRPPLEPEVREQERRHETERHHEHGEKRTEVEEGEEEVEEKPGTRKHREWRRERTHREGEREGEGEEEEVVEERETKTRERTHHREEREPRHRKGEEEEEVEEEEEEYRRRRRSREQEGQKGKNFLEETICTLRLHENIADPSRADIFNPRAGRITTVNSLTLPVLKLLHLSAQWVNLYKDGIFVPHWNMNANSIMYVTRGRGRVQVINNKGKSVFNGEVRRGNLVVVPQNFAVAKQAGEEGLEFIAFKTNEKAEISTMVGRDSAISGTPAEVLANAFGFSLEEVNALKNNRNEGVLATPDSRIRDAYIATAVSK